MAKGFFLKVFVALFAWTGLSGMIYDEEFDSDYHERVEYISVVVKDLKFTAGSGQQRETQVCYAVFAGPEGFPSDPEKVVLKGCKRVDSTVVSFLIEGLPESEDGYVVSLFQDMNMNGKLDTRNIFGIQVPDEPFGFSGNPPLTGAPTYQKCRIVPARNGERFEILMKKIGG